MGRDGFIPEKVIQDQIARIDEQVREIDERRARLRVERDVLTRLLSEYKPDGHGHHNGHLGPTYAVRRLVAENPGVYSRGEVVDAAVPIVTTDPRIARKTLAQTVLNLMGRDELAEVNGKLVPGPNAKQP